MGETLSFAATGVPFGLDSSDRQSRVVMQFSGFCLYSAVPLLVDRTPPGSMHAVVETKIEISFPEPRCPQRIAAWVIRMLVN